MKISPFKTLKEKNCSPSPTSNTLTKPSSKFPLLLGEGYLSAMLYLLAGGEVSMHNHLPNYTKSSIPSARRLRREMTEAEVKIWSHLRGNNLGVKIRRQVPHGKYILDFFCARAKLGIELDGSQHYTEEGLLKDAERDSYLRAQDIEVLHITNGDALTNTDGVVELIYETIRKRLHSKTPSQPSPKRGRRTVIEE